MRVTKPMLAVLLSAAVGVARAAEETKPAAKTAPPLAGLPSKPGPHIAQIEALGDNQWLKLPDTAADTNCPSWHGKSYGRSWTQRASYCAELGGAFVTGEANHGANSGGYYGDDVWFYDLYANRWINLYPGTHIPSFAQKLTNGTYAVGEHGTIREKKTDRLVPVIPLGGHGGWAMDYDKANRKFAWVGTTAGGQYKPKDVEKAYMEAMKSSSQTWWTGQANHDYANPHRHGMWTYDVATGEFGFLYGGPDRYVAGDLYVDSKKQIMSIGEKRQWWYDLAQGKVTAEARKGDAPPGPANTYGSCYDAKRDRVYIFGSLALNMKTPESAAEHLWYYDVAGDKWVKPAPRDAPNVRIDNGRFMMGYDSVNDRVVVFYIIHNIKDPAARNIYVYDPEKNAFEQPIPVADRELPTGYGHSFYCPEANAFFIHQARADNALGNVHAWRYRRAPEKK